MEILYILIPVSVILVALAVGVFGWAVKNGQYDDLEGPAHSILFDDDQDMIPRPDHQTGIKHTENNVPGDVSANKLP